MVFKSKANLIGYIPRINYLLHDITWAELQVVEEEVCSSYGTLREEEGKVSEVQTKAEHLLK